MEQETSLDDLPLVQAVRRFLDQHEMSPVTFGRKALKDPHFVRDITKAEKPRRVWPDTEDKVRAYMRDYLPESQAKAA